MRIILFLSRFARLGFLPFDKNSMLWRDTLLHAHSCAMPNFSPYKCEGERRVCFAPEVRTHANQTLTGDALCADRFFLALKTFYPNLVCVVVFVRHLPFVWRPCSLQIVEILVRPAPCLFVIAVDWQIFVLRAVSFGCCDAMRCGNQCVLAEYA